MILPDNVYQILKWVGSIVCPALSIFVKTICDAVGWEWGDVASTILVALGVLICSLIQASSANYYEANANNEIAG